MDERGKESGNRNTVDASHEPGSWWEESKIAWSKTYQGWVRTDSYMMFHDINCLWHRRAHWFWYCIVTNLLASGSMILFKWICEEFCVRSYEVDFFERPTSYQQGWAWFWRRALGTTFQCWRLSFIGEMPWWLLFAPQNVDLGVSINGGYPEIIHWNRIVHYINQYKPYWGTTIYGSPPFRPPGCFYFDMSCPSGHVVRRCPLSFWTQKRRPRAFRRNNGWTTWFQHGFSRVKPCASYFLVQQCVKICTAWRSHAFLMHGIREIRGLFSGRSLKLWHPCHRLLDSSFSDGHDVRKTLNPNDIN